MKKIYVLDTNVLLQDPMAIFSFRDNDVILPAIVLEEVDSKKRLMDEIGRNARYVAKLLDELRLKGQLHKGVTMENGGDIRVELNHRSFTRMQDLFLDMTNDNRILAVALNLHHEEQQKEKAREVVLVTKDALLRVKADAIGLPAEDFLSDRVVHEYSNLYKGYTTVKAPVEAIQHFYGQHSFELKRFLPNIPLHPNEFVIMKDELGGSSSAIGRVSGDGKLLLPLLFGDEIVWGVKARNAQQKMAMELLLNKEIPLITLTGKAGTGKTLLSLAAGLMLTEDDHEYKKLLVARPIVPLGKDIGYLPGEKEEKLKPWMQPIYDNLEYLFNTKQSGDLDKILAGLGSIQVEALTYIRGRSIPEQFIIIDEAQNLTKHEVKTILTRVGENSKIILMGDPQQIDHPYLDEVNNGLTYVVEMFKNEKMSGHIALQKGERSSLAQLAADLL